MKIYEVFACKRCWACLWFICFFTQSFRLVFQGSQWANLQRSAQVSRLAGAHKALGTLRTGWSGHRRTHTACQLPKQCLALSPKRLPGFWRPSVDRFGSELVSWCKFSLKFGSFSFGVFRGGRQWLQLRVIVSEDASCESQSRTNSEPAVIHLRFGSLSTTWRTSLTQQFNSEHVIYVSTSQDVEEISWLQPNLQMHNEPNQNQSHLELGIVGPCLAILPDIADIAAIMEKMCHGVPMGRNQAVGWQRGAGIQFRHLR